MRVQTASGLLNMSSVLFRFDHFGHGHAELVFDQHDLAACDEAVVDVDVDGFADLAVEFEHSAGSKLEQFADLHVGAAEYGGNLHRDVEDGFQVGGTAIMPGVRVRHWHDIRRRCRVFGFEIGERYFSVT